MLWGVYFLKVLKAMGAKTIELRASVHKEEVEKCKSEIKAGKVPQKSLEDRCKGRVITPLTAGPIILVFYL